MADIDIQQFDALAKDVDAKFAALQAADTADDAAQKTAIATAAAKAQATTDYTTSWGNLTSFVTAPAAPAAPAPATGSGIAPLDAGAATTAATVAGDVSLPAQS